MGFFWMFLGMALVLIVAFQGWNQHDCIAQRGNWNGSVCVFTPSEGG